MRHASNRWRGEPCFRHRRRSKFLVRGDITQMFGDHLRVDPRKIESLTARKDGDRQFVRFGGAEDEFYVPRRLFENFQQSVERLAGEHVHSSIM